MLAGFLPVKKVLKTSTFPSFSVLEDAQSAIKIFGFLPVRGYDCFRFASIFSTLRTCMRIVSPSDAHISLARSRP